MAENYFSDYPERVDQVFKYSRMEELIGPLEEAFGEKDFFQSPQEGMDVYRDMLSELGKFCANEIRPTANDIDRQGCKFQNGEVIFPEALTSHLKRCKDLGVYAGPVARKHGGYNIPRVVQAIAAEMLAHACPNTALTVCAFSMGDFIQTWGTEEQKAFYIPKLISNEWQTSMSLTEPGAGSDLGQLRTTARKTGDHYLVNGTKQFITNGNADITFALVRTGPNPTGLDGLSVLIIPKQLDGKSNFKVAKIEDKICLHASPTCELVFENSQGYLLGPEGEGFKVMLDLMNTARMAMSALAVGISVAALDEAKKYARTRITMGKPIIQHPMVADLIHEMEIETRAMRAMVCEASNAYDWMQIFQSRGDEKSFKRWRTRFRRLTPLCKYYCSEKSITIAKNALQIFGGYGVCKDYPMERLLRESIIYPIYEGTSQIQSLMVLKDTMKDVAQHATGFLGSLAGAWAESLLVRDPMKVALLQARNELNQGIKTILGSVIKTKFKEDIESLKSQKIQGFLREFSLQLMTSKTDLTMPFLLAERFTRITCDYYALKCLADQCPPEDQERRYWVQEFAALAIPRMRLENTYMTTRLPSTLDLIKKEVLLSQTQ